MRISSPGWSSGSPVPKRFTADGEDLSPPLVFEDVPSGVAAFALICDDPDAPVGTWVHWVIYDIPGSARGLAEGLSTAASLPDGTRQGVNSWKKTGYGGPSPPPGKPHRYFFRLYALRSKLGGDVGNTAEAVEASARKSPLAKAEFMGTYGRPAGKAR